MSIYERIGTYNSLILTHNSYNYLIVKNAIMWPVRRLGSSDELFYLQPEVGISEDRWSITHCVVFLLPTSCSNRPSDHVRLIQFPSIIDGYFGFIVETMFLTT